jgi:hypothetical protein
MKIVFEPFAGLGNRMRALDSVFPLARKFGAELRVLWPLYRDLNCRFEDLFEVPSGISKIDTIGWGMAERLRVLVHRLSSEVFIDQARMTRLIEDHYDFDGLAGHSTVFIKTYSRFHESPPLYRDFVPVASLRRIIDRHELDERFVGVHIRRGDNDVSTAESPFDLFVEKMNREVELDAEVAFFVATDSPEVESQLRKIFGSRIVSHAKTSLDRNAPQGIKDGVVDLYCLSRCRKVLGSYWSSFSETAAALRGIEHVVVRSPDRRRHPA